MELVGRDQERLTLRERIASERVVAICGPPGVGKTRLALECSGDALLVSMVDLETAEQIRRAISRALRLEPGDSPPRAALDRALERHRGLLILDACDRVAPALPALVEGWSDTRLLLTSRRELGIGFSVELGPLGAAASLTLWQRACGLLGHASPAPEAELILAHLDGLPRAIEWTASRAALLGERACLARLGELRPDESALEGSLDLLEEPLRDALETLTMFSRGATVALLEELGVSLDAIDALRRRSLVRVSLDGDPPRVAAYRPVATAVEARSRARGSWEALARSHAEATLAAAEPDRGDLEAVFSRCRDSEPDLAMRAALALLPKDLAGRGASESAARIGALMPSLGRGALRDRAELGLARCARRAGDLDGARAHLEAAGDGVEVILERAHIDRQESRAEAAAEGYGAALKRARRSGPDGTLAHALGEVGRMLQSAGRPREAQARHLEAIALSHASGDAEREALERSLYARAVHRAGAPDEAIPLHERALELHTAMGHPRLAAAERGHLAYCHHEVGDLEEAERLFTASVTGLAAVGDVVLESIERLLLARLLVDRGRTAEARVELALARAHELGMPRVALTAHFVAGLIEAFEGRLEEARDAWRAGVSLGVHQEVGFERLLPAHLAWAERELGAVVEPPPSLALASPGVTLALEILRGAIGGGSAPAVDEQIEARSSDVRRARAMTARATIELSSDGRFVWLQDGTKVDLSRRNAPRRILGALSETRLSRPGVSLSREQLIEAGWPGERIRPDAADKRLRTAIWTLRKAGLETLLLTRDDGYLLDPTLPFVKKS